MYKNIKILITATLPLLLFMAYEKPDEDSIEGGFIYEGRKLDTTVLKYFPKYDFDTITYQDEDGNLYHFITKDGLVDATFEYGDFMTISNLLEGKDTVGFVMEKYYEYNKDRLESNIENYIYDRYNIVFVCEELNAEMKFFFEDIGNVLPIDTQTKGIIILVFDIEYETYTNQTDLALTNDWEHLFDILKSYNTDESFGINNQGYRYNPTDTFGAHNYIVWWYDSIYFNGMKYTNLQFERFYKRYDTILSSFNYGHNNDFVAYSYDRSLIAAFRCNGKQYVLVETNKNKK